MVMCALSGLNVQSDVLSVCNKSVRCVLFTVPARGLLHSGEVWIGLHLQYQRSEPSIF